MIITVSGIPSSGKSTISKLLCAKLGIERKSVGDIIKSMSGNKHINDFYRELENNPELEKKIDMEQKKWGEDYDDFLIEGRTSFYFMPKRKSYNVFFDLSLETAAERAYSKAVSESENPDYPHKYKSYDDALSKIKERMEIENNRYKKLYGIDNLKLDNYDLVINAEGTKEEVFTKFYDAIIKELSSRKHSYK